MLIAVFALSSQQPALARDDFQYWSQYSVDLLDTDKFNFKIFSDNRFFDDAKDVGFYLVSTRLKYKATKYLDLGMNYSYLNSKVNNPIASRSEFKFHHRVELEVNPYWNLMDWLKLYVRNRYEFRWIEDKGSDNARIRQRWQLTVPVKDKWRLKSIYASAEIFYDQPTNAFNENWITPVGGQFKVSEKVSFDLYYMIQSKKGTHDWASNQILATVVSFKF